MATPSAIKCPVCGKHLKKISYRFYDLELKYVPESDGIYLDAHEEERLVELLSRTKKAITGKQGKRMTGGKFNPVKSKTFFSKVKSFFSK